MRKHKLLLASVLAVFGCAVAAQSVECNVPLLSMEGVARAQCEVRDGVRIEVYFGTSEPVMYDTKEFDRRRLDIIRGTNRANVERELDRIRDPASTLRTSIAIPRNPDAVVKRSAQRSRRYQKWRIEGERVHYFGRGGRPGYFVRCYTASRVSAAEVMVVGECFDPWSESRFFKTLDEIR